MGMTDDENASAPTYPNNPPGSSLPSTSSPAGGAQASAGYTSSATSTPYTNSTTPTSVPGGLGAPTATAPAPGLFTPQTDQRREAITEAEESAASAETAAPAPPAYVAPVTGVFIENSSNPFKASRASGTRYHAGADWRAANGSTAVAAIGGTVVFVGNNPGGYDHYANVKGDDGNYWRYAPHASVSVNVGQRIEAGETIGAISRRHLHLEVITPESPRFGQFEKSGNASTKWLVGGPGPFTVNQEQFFGLPRGLKVTAGRPFDLAAGVDPYGGGPFRRVTPGVMAGVNPPNPNVRPDTSSPAFGAKGARSVPPAPPPVAAIGDEVLELGNPIEKGRQGEFVAQWQGVLNHLGHVGLETDGRFGRQTKNATKAFQLANDIEVDGVVGPETFNAALAHLYPHKVVLPGKVAYTAGEISVTPIIDPAGTFVDVRVPAARPARLDGEVVPNPRGRPGRYTEADGAGDPLVEAGKRGKQATSSDPLVQASIDAGQQVREPDEMIDRFILQSASAATRQRLGYLSSGAADRFRMAGQASSTDAYPVAARATEAIREYARGVGDSYRRVIDRRRFDAFRPRPGFAEGEETEEVIVRSFKAMPTADEAAVGFYAFPPGDFFEKVDQVAMNLEGKRQSVNVADRRDNTWIDEVGNYLGEVVVDWYGDVFRRAGELIVPPSYPPLPPGLAPEVEDK